MKCRRWTLAANPLFARLALTIVPALATSIPAAHSQTYTVTHNVTNGAWAGNAQASYAIC
jgi:hypothetical protein